MNFKQAVESVPALKGAYRTGLQALTKNHKHLITADGNNLTGSVNLDESLKKGEHAQASRWDYGIGYKRNNSEVAVWIEVHPASSTGEVENVSKKLKWLKDFLDAAPQLRAMTFAFFWVAKGGVNQRLHQAPQSRSDILRALRGPVEHLNLDEVVR